MGILKSNQKIDIRFEKGDFKIYEPTDYQREEIINLLKNQNLVIEGDAIKGEVDFGFIKHILRECTSIANEVDEYSDKELSSLLDNGNRNIKLFMIEIKRLIDELIEDLLFVQEEELKLIVKILNILNTNTTKAEIEKKFNNLMRRNKLNLTLQDVINNQGNPEQLQDMIRVSKKNNSKKK